MKHYLATPILVLILYPVLASAQVSPEEFEALLGANKEEELAGEVQVEELTPELYYSQIDSNQLALDAMRSNIERLKAQKELLEIQAEIDLLESGASLANTQGTANGFNPSGSVNVVDSTMPLSQQNAAIESESQARIEELEEQLISVQAMFDQRLAEVQGNFDSQLQELNEPVEPQPTEPELAYDPALYNDHAWSLLATTGSDGDRRAEIVDYSGYTHLLKVGDQAGPITVKRISQREVAVETENGESFTIIPRALISRVNFFEPQQMGNQGMIFDDSYQPGINVVDTTNSAGGAN